MYKIEIEKIDELYELVHKLRIYIYLQRLVSDNEFENSIPEEDIRLYVDIHNFIAENNFFLINEIEKLIRGVNFYERIN